MAVLLQVVAAAATTLFVLDIVVLVDSVNMPLDSDNHLLQAEVTAAEAAEATATTALGPSEVTELESKRF